MSEYMRKLLILGATASEISLIKRAKEYGCYVIVTDNHEDWTMSPAKYAADEAWNVSWADIDALERLCREHGVEGATAGYSEFRVESLIRLCRRMGFPCYINEEQLAVTRDKIQFKEMCRRCGVPTVREYASPAEVDRFPVIVKPVDRAGSIGISVATDPASLDQAYAYAMEMSVSKRVIIEDFIQNGVKVDFYYGVEDGEITLLSCCGTINAKDNGTERVVQSAWLYPMQLSPEHVEPADAAMRHMIRRMGVQYGCIFFSGFADPSGELSFFECGFRLEGAHQYGYVERRGLVNFLDIFIQHAMTGSTCAIRRPAVQEPEMKCVTVNLYAGEGTIAAIRGMEQIAAMEDCSLALIQSRVGVCCRADKAILTKVGMFAFCHPSPARLRQDVERAYELFSVTDEAGRDMLYDRIDTRQIETWWNREEAWQ